MKIRQRVLAVLVAVFFFFCSCFSVGAVTYDELDTGYQAIWDAYVAYMASVFKGVPSEAFRNLVKLDETIFFTELDGVKAILLKSSNVYYYLDDNGNLCVDDGHHSGGGGSHSSSSGGGSGRRRVSSGSDIYVEAPSFKNLLVTANSFYAPCTNDLALISYQNFNNSTIKNRYCLDLAKNLSSGGHFPGGSSTDCYMLPFVYIDGVYYFGIKQLHISVSENTFNTPELYVFSESSAPSSTFTFNQCDELSNVQYLIVAYPRSSNGWNLIDFFGYSNGDGYINNSNRTLYGGANLPNNFHCYTESDFTVNVNVADISGNVNGSPDFENGDDCGFYCSPNFIPMSGFYSDIDPEKIPDDTFITLTGDTIYDYSITNTAGNTTSINNYITNNYNYPSSDNPSGGSGGGSSGGGTTSGDVNVGGNVNVNGNIDVGGSVDVNINVNSGGGADINDYIDVDPVETNVDEILAAVPSVSKGFIDYLTGFFAWLPKEIYGLLVLGLVVAVWCRLMGR